MGTTPFTLWGFFKFRLQTHQMICSWTSITKDDFTTLLTNLAIVLMFRLKEKKKTENENCWKVNVFNETTELYC